MESHQTKLKLMSKGRVKCVKCGYTWTPKVENPSSCANRKCRRKIIYDPVMEDPEESVIEMTSDNQGSYIQIMEDPEDQIGDVSEMNDDLIDNPNIEAVTESEDPLEIPEDQHPQSSDEMDGDQIHEGTGLRLKQLDQISNPSNPSGLYTNQDQYKNPSSGKTLEKSPISLPDPEPEMLSPLMGGLFEEDEHQETASQEISGFLKKHKGSLENKIAQTGISTATGGALGGIDSIFIDGAKMIIKLIMMKLNENKTQNERERVKKLIQEQKAEEVQPQTIRSPKPTPQREDMRIISGPNVWDEDESNASDSWKVEKPSPINNADLQSRDEESHDNDTPNFWDDTPEPQADPEKINDHQIIDEIEPNQRNMEDDILKPNNVEGLEITEAEMKDGLNQILNILSIVPKGQIIDAINQKQDLIKEYEAMILNFITPESLKNIKAIFDIPLQDLNQMINDFAKQNPSNENLQLINTNEGRGLIEFNISQLKNKLQELGM